MKRIFARLAVFALIACGLSAQAATTEQAVAFRIAAQPLDSALVEFSRQSGLQLVVSSETTRGKSSQGVQGSFQPTAALKMLLAGSGLDYSVVNPRSLAIRTASPRSSDSARNQADHTYAAQLAAVSAEPAAAARSVNDADEQEAQRSGDGQKDAELVVTGSHIRGVRNVASPSIVMTRQDILESGHLTLEDAFRYLPQNFSEVSAEGVRTEGGTRLAGFNTSRGTGVDLRGLGADSTLSLLNGQRRTASLSGRVVDISVIPLSVIERVEVVAGGRSATYGSDAVGGVVNFVTRRDFTGAETQFSYNFGAAGGEVLQASQIAGKSGERGGFVAAYDYRREQRLNMIDLGVVAETDPYGIEQVDIGQPDTWRHSVFTSGHYALNDRVHLFADGLYSYMKVDSLDLYYIPGADDNSFDANLHRDDHIGVTAGAQIDLGSAWALAVTAGHSQFESDVDYGYYQDYGDGFPFGGEILSTARLGMSTLSAVADGALPSFGGISPRTAFGAEVREETRRTVNSGVRGRPGDRTVRSVFAEVQLPWQRLEISLAGRYDDYTEFGGTFNPQLGVIFEPVAGLMFKAAYSSAFRAPALNDVNPNNTSGRLVHFPDPDVVGGQLPVLLLTGSNPGVGPESADTWSTGLEYQPQWAPASHFSLHYFNVKYDDRLDVPAAGSDQILFLERADRFVDLIDAAPTAQRAADALASLSQPLRNSSGVPFDPATQSLLTVFPDLIIFDNRTNNIATESVSGLDVGAGTRYETPVGSLTIDVNGTYTFDHDRNVTATSPEFSRVNEVGKPAGMRVRAKVGWRRGSYGAFVQINHVNDYRNSLTVPTSGVKSWTTANLTLRYDGGAAVRSNWLNGLSVLLSAQNLFDTDPPLIGGGLSPLLYDPANASGLGRRATIQLTKRW